MSTPSSCLTSFQYVVYLVAGLERATCQTLMICVVLYNRVVHVSMQDIEKDQQLEIGRLL